MRRLLIVPLLLGIGLIGVVMGADQPSSTLRVCLQGPPACDFAQIQQAIDAAPPGATLEIGAGTYEENLSIVDKPLTLRGQGENTIIQGVLPTVPVVQIRATQPSPVILEEISVIAPLPDPSFPFGPDGVVISGSTQAVLRCVQISRADGAGVSIQDTAQVTIEDSQFFHNGDGIAADGRSRVTIRRALAFGNGTGARIGGSAQVQLEEVRILTNGGSGISIGGLTQVLIQDSDIAGNGFGGPLDGIIIFGAADVQILQSAIYGNHGHGLSILDGPDSAIKVELSRSFIFSNRFSGIFAHLGNPDTHVELTENEIYANLERYGVEVETPPLHLSPYHGARDDIGSKERDSRSGGRGGQSSRSRLPG